MVQISLAKRPAVTGTIHTLKFEQLLALFKRDIKGLASTYPEFWKKDFYQLGTIALFEAQTRFSIIAKPQAFRPYALKAIRRRMIDFNDKTVERRLKTSHKVITHDDAEEEAFIYNYSRDSDFFSLATFTIDYESIFDPIHLRARGFSEQEITAFQLHIESDLKVTDVATELKITIGRASQVLASLRAKSKELVEEVFK